MLCHHSLFPLVFQTYFLNPTFSLTTPIRFHPPIHSPPALSFPRTLSSQTPPLSPAAPSIPPFLRQSVTPNGMPGIDGMISTIAHEVTEAATNPDVSSGWMASDGEENADMCVWQYGDVSQDTDGDGNTYDYNMVGNDGMRFMVEASAALLEQSSVYVYEYEYDYSPEALAASATLLEQNPDVYVTWNYRKKAPSFSFSPPSLPFSYSPEALATSAALLEQNPDVYVTWNYRKKAFAHRCGALEAGEGGSREGKAVQRGSEVKEGEKEAQGKEGQGEGGKEAQGEGGSGEGEVGTDGAMGEAESAGGRGDKRGESEVGGENDGKQGEEQERIEAALRTNPKCYGAWHHRKWLFALSSTEPLPSLGANLGPSLQQVRINLRTEARIAREQKLLGMMLSADDRNFHAWDYWRFMSHVARMSPSKDLGFTMERINANFSNYSAWHSRSKLLPMLHACPPPPTTPTAPEAKGLPQAALEEECELVRQAFFTEPEDQSGWMYQHWLLQQILPPLPPRLLSSWPSPGSTVCYSSPENPPEKSSGGDSAAGEGVSESSPRAPRQVRMSAVLVFSEPVVGVTRESVTLMGAGMEVGEWRAVGGEEAWLSGRQSGCERETGGDVGPKSASCDVSCDLDHAVPVWCGPSNTKKNSSTHFSYPVSFPPASSFGSSLALSNPKPRSPSRPAPPCLQQVSYPLLRPPVLHFLSQLKQSPIPPSLLPPLSNPSTIVFQQVGSPLSLPPPLHSLSQMSSYSPPSPLHPFPPPPSPRSSSKWALLSLARLLSTRRQLHHLLPNLPVQARQDAEACEEVRSLLRRLVGIDPYHKEYYRDLLEALEGDEVRRSSRPTPLSACSGNIPTLICASSLRPTPPGFEALQNLQVLDLSHNHIAFSSAIAPLAHLPALRTLSLAHNLLGAKPALQNLQVLDLSHNSIAFSSAIAPLAHLPALRALSLAHNLLGGKPVDRHRYCHPSPRCNRFPSWNMPSNSTGDEVSSSAEAAAAAAATVDLVQQHPNLWTVLQCLGGLRQVAVLDLTGNPVCQWDGYRQLVLSLLPQLVLFDGGSV
ncbi:unnamed protein product [Closterium sp. NIES-65]|nr:unnamed protein product [Closterium sp. NIES-65]